MILIIKNHQKSIFERSGFENKQHVGQLKQTRGLPMMVLWRPQIWYSSVSSNPRTRERIFRPTRKITQPLIFSFHWNLVLGSLRVPGGRAVVTIDLSCIQDSADCPQILNLQMVVAAFCRYSDLIVYYDHVLSIHMIWSTVLFSTVFCMLCLF